GALARRSPDRARARVTPRIDVEGTRRARGRLALACYARARDAEAPPAARARADARAGEDRHDRRGVRALRLRRAALRIRRPPERPSRRLGGRTPRPGRLRPRARRPHGGPLEGARRSWFNR